MRNLENTKSNNNFRLFEKWRRSSLTIAFLLILFCFVMGNDHYNAYALVRKNRAIIPNREIISYQNIPKPQPAWLISKYLAGGDNCAAATNVTVSPFNDTGNTTGANNTVTLYNRPALPFTYFGPDQYYRIVIGLGGGSIGASMDLTGSTLDGALFLTNVCPAGTGNTVPAANALGNSQDDAGPGAGPEVLPVITVPAGTYFLGIDSYYGSGSASAGPYSITINAVNLATPTAAGVSVSGRIINAQGSGISGVSISITKSSGEAITVRTNSFGYYKFEEIEVGAIYTIQAADKRYQFGNPTQVVTINDAVEDLDFTALP